MASVAQQESRWFMKRFRDGEEGADSLGRFPGFPSWAGTAARGEKAHCGEQFHKVTTR